MKVYMILDLQFGSTGKGLLAGYLAKKHQPDVVATAWGPNAGHTFIDTDGREYVHRMLANGIVSPKLEYVLIGPGSVIDLDCLLAEVRSCADLMRGKWLVIHPQAVVVTQEHRQTEARNVKIGSTMKGTGAAVIERIERDPENNPTAQESIPTEFYDAIKETGAILAVSAPIYSAIFQSAECLQIEGAQGFSLSMYHGFYPYTTSRDVTPAQVMADCAIPWDIRPEVYGTLRTYPIRVANRFDADGNMIGTSGPCYSDQTELNWEDVGLEPELTTVTKLPRRIFTFSKRQLADALRLCGPSKLFLNFCNYMTPSQLEELVSEIRETANGSIAHLAWLGFGPTVNDVYSHHPDALDQFTDLMRKENA